MKRCVVKTDGTVCRGRVGENRVGRKWTCKRHIRYEATITLWNRLKEVPIELLMLIGEFRVSPPYGELWQNQSELSDYEFWLNYRIAREATERRYSREVFSRFY